MQYFALGIQGYIRKLREFLASKSATELNTKENKLKATALKSVTNINSLIKDLFHCPPSYKTKIIVSWKPQSEEKVSNRIGAQQSKMSITNLGYNLP